MNITPRYIIDIKKFRQNCQEIMNAFYFEWGDNVEYGYSVKTNRDTELMKYATEALGWNIEVVSFDEYTYSKSLGVTDERIIFNGPTKDGVINTMRSLPRVINLDHYEEVREFITTFPDYKGMVGLRVNFDLEKKCPGETTAGEEVSRFGIDAESDEFSQCVDLLKKNGINNIGLHLHTSTKTRSLNVFLELARKAVMLKKETGTDYSFVDIGGGFFGGKVSEGKPSMTEYANTICKVLKEEYNPEYTKIILEPGASVLATCVSYETKVINRRIIRGVDVCTVDGTMLHINPFMSKRVQPFVVMGDDYNKRVKKEKQIVCGATCMENDRLAVLDCMEELIVGDILSFKYVGAYSMTFNSKFILNPPTVEYINKEV